MPKSLLAILKTPQPTKEVELDTDKRFSPHKRELAVKDFLRMLKVQDPGYPFGNEDAFTASKLKPFARAINNYGKDNIDYNNVKSVVEPGETGVNPNEETIDELSNKTLTNYIKNAANRTDKTQYPLRRHMVGINRAADRLAGKFGKKGQSYHAEELTESGPTRKHFRDVANTVRAIENPEERQKFSDHHAEIFARQNPKFNHKIWHAAAGTKTREERGIKENTLSEHLPSNASSSAYIHDFVHSKNKKFKGDSKKERIKRALGAYYKHHGEETEVNELSKATLRSYRVKAHQEAKKGNPKKYQRLSGAYRAGDRLLGRRMDLDKNKYVPYHAEETIDELSRKTLQSYQDKVFGSDSARKSTHRAVGFIRAGKKLSGKAKVNATEELQNEVRKERITADQSRVDQAAVNLELAKKKKKRKALREISDDMMNRYLKKAAKDKKKNRGKGIALADKKTLHSGWSQHDLDDFGAV